MKNKPFDLEDWIYRIKTYGKGKRLLKVCEWREYPEEDVAIFCALIPDEKVQHVLNSPGWDLRPGSGVPACYIQHHAFGRGKHEYGYDSGRGTYETLVHHRTWHGVKDSCVEVSEEFRLFYNLYHVRDKNKWVKIDDDGREEDAILYTTREQEGYLSVEISRKLLNDFCLVKKMHLAIYFEIKRKRPESLKKLGLTPKSGKKITDNLTCLSLVYQDRWSGEGSWSGLYGKRLFPGTMRDQKGPWEDRDPEYQEFIVGVDDEGEELRATCGPSEELRKRKEASYYTLTYFRREVLTKYYSHPEKYQVEDGSIRCKALWGLNIDNNHGEYISAFLGDLGMLGQQEQEYWKSFNYWPTRRGLSETAYKRDILGEFASPRSPEFLFKSSFTDFQDRYQRKFGAPLFQELEAEDQHNVTALRVPCNEGQAEFDAQILSLCKILVDSLSEKEIERRLEDFEDEIEKFTGEGRTLQKLEKLLTKTGVEQPRKHLEVLWDIQGLRSSFAAHRKGNNSQKWAKKLRLKETGLQPAFSQLLLRGRDLLDFLAESPLLQSSAKTSENQS